MDLNRSATKYIQRYCPFIAEVDKETAVKMDMKGVVYALINEPNKEITTKNM